MLAGLDPDKHQPASSIVDNNHTLTRCASEAILSRLAPTPTQRHTLYHHHPLTIINPYSYTALNPAIG